jgi:hydrogenase expression/formation protein HypE
MSWYTRLWKHITLAHGSGGLETGLIIEKMIKSKVPREYWKVPGGTGLDILDDSALIPLGDNRYMAFTIDAYTVQPIFFPGGDIGKLAASGTINDLLMVGAKPLAAVDSIIVEEGFPTSDLDRILESYITTLTREKVHIVGGDFKVMPKGQVDKIIITSAGIGVVEGKPIRDDMITPGDKIVVSGPLGEHGAAILSVKENLGVKFEVESDVKPLTDLMLPILEKYRTHVHGAGDPTRGGLSMLLNDWASKTVEPQT